MDNIGVRGKNFVSFVQNIVSNNKISHAYIIELYDIIHNIDGGMNMEEKFLPVGTVVLLQNGTKRVMINGFCSIDSEDPNTVYDYSGVLFPEGSLSSDQTLLFNHDQIVRIDHMGLIDDEETEFKAKLAEILAAEAQQ